MPVMLPADSMFLIGESREHPMHVGGLQLYRKPAGAGPDHVGEVFRELLTYTEVRRLLRRRPADPVSSLGQLWWTDDDDIDLEYHVRLSALPRPGKVRQLLELVSRLHGTLLDRHRPLWEFHLIDGLEDDRFATYMKIHHSIVDGVAAMSLLTDTLAPDPGLRDA
ncbi:MAG: wax ester/triacylglycerol synthase family O-acyltransferase, partial [Pseudonocardia sp.]|nr:wax ester/triacylglycerol synthase family O-acyltransferase [Pseudonocardia sp.]